MNGNMENRRRQVNPSDRLNRMRVYFQRMKALAENEKTALTGGDMEGLLRIVKEREQLRAQIDTLAQHSLEETGLEWWEASGSGESQNAVVSEISLIITRIQDTDRETDAFLRARRNQITGEIHKMREGRRALKGYGGRRTVAPRFLEKNA
jgi:catalase (peroxidase I)